ncbi:MAG: Crp/Fnr family transcriptional regulator [Magnetospiraceae bacterium]
MVGDPEATSPGPEGQKRTFSLGKGTSVLDRLSVVENASALGTASLLDKLRINELLIDLDDSAFEDFADGCVFLSAPENDVVIQEGDKQEHTFFVIEGVVRIVLGSKGDTNVTFRDVTTGGYFGEIAAIDRGDRSATAYSLQDSLIAAVPCERFLTLVLEHRSIALKLLRGMASALRHSNQKISQVSSFSGVQRVYLELLNRGEPSPAGDGSWIIPVMPTHEDLAAEAMTSKDMVARAMSQLFQLEVAKRERGRLKVLDRDRLKRLATQN